MTSEELVARLAGALRPVRRLPPPPVLLAGWTALAMAVIGLAAALIGVHRTEGAGVGGFESLHLLGAALTALLAGLAAFELALPDRDRRWGWLPLPGLALWLGTMGAGCLGQWMDAGPDGIPFWVSWQCMGFIAGLGLPLSVAILWLTRHAAWARPGPVAACGALSAAAFASLGLTLVHPTYGPVMVLAWHGLAVLAVTGLMAMAAPRLMRAA
ncbi:MAG: DUF1109 domain-containing protein [Rubritepida sp.]|nr:DUF1109 domain-containing protein [Rubritepida sp.]MCU0943765.1 DUF1109 domain-containing protein [Rubritepida sp.]